MIIINGVDPSDSARYTGPLPISELEIKESTARWDAECRRAKNKLWFDEFHARMRKGIAEGIAFLDSRPRSRHKIR